MTVLCGGGTSSLKPGSTFNQVIAGGLISEGLTLISPILLPAGLMIDAFLWEGSSQCGTDPPALPSFSADDILNLVGGVFNPAHDITLAKVKDLILRWLWFQNCQCDAVTTPAFVNPSLPPNTSMPLPTTSAGCYNGSWTGSTPLLPAATTTNPRPNYLTLVPPDGVDSQIPFASGAGPSMVRSVPVGKYQSYKMTGTAHFPAGSATNASWLVNEFKADGTFITNHVFTFTPSIPGPLTNTFSANVLTGLIETYATLNASDPAGVPTMDLAIQWNCSGGTSGFVNVPCPPDPAVLNLLQQIWQLLQLVQRQAVPFSLVHGDTHSALTGSGEITLQGLLGVKVLPSSIPAAVGRDIGDPDSLWLDSWLRWGNTDGWKQREFLTSSPFVSMPEYAGQWTKLGYTLRPGLTVDIVELKREP